jgi:uncharacterized membrane protein HdeD (DUF308 family)
MSGSQAHRSATVVLSVLMVVIGVALLVEALSAGSPLSPRMVLGVLFVVAGMGRLYLVIRRARQQ